MAAWTFGAIGRQLVYADFEQVQDGRRSAHRRDALGIRRTRRGRPPGLVRTKPDDPNRMAKFDFELVTPNQWSGVTLEIKGQPDKDGKTPPDDVSGYKTLSMDVFATGVATMRVEMLSRGWGQDTNTANPQITFKPKQGLNTYRVALKTFAQPSWVTDTRIDPKDVLKNLTAVSISAYLRRLPADQGNGGRGQRGVREVRGRVYDLPPRTLCLTQTSSTSTPARSALAAAMIFCCWWLRHFLVV